MTRDGYTPGWGTDALRMTRSRGAGTRAAFVLPLLRNGMRVLAVASSDWSGAVLGPRTPAVEARAAALSWARQDGTFTLRWVQVTARR